MSKLILTLFFLCLTMSACAQTVSSMNPSVYVFNNGKDTIHLKKLDLGRMMISSSVKIVDSIQIDGAGAKELILLRKGGGFTNEHGGSFDISESKSLEKFEIWDPATKTLLFEAISFWSYDYDIFRAGHDANPLFKYQGKGSEKYKYDFFVNTAGNIVIDNFCGSKDTKPDHVVGTYQYKDGKYILKTDEPAKN